MKIKTVNRNTNAIKVSDLVQSENEIQEDFIMEDTFTDVEIHNEIDATEINENNKLINDQLKVDIEFQAGSNVKGAFAEKANNNNEIDVTGIIDCTNLSLSIGIAEDIPIIISNTPSKAQHDVPVENSLEQHSSLLELNFQQMGTTQIKTTPTPKIESDSTGEPNSNSERVVAFTTKCFR
ncbi:unnamed protein product [Acanthoscelides obtectus]|uniref:Uncharacterized protein n=1 Tax=Acanthoscelides obtectus TaxID=200917 RepID=A0A9P0NWT9_ACAOB|nr:unnamed protein product [Acanthoscelides obtectus]CAK1641319.1 hypothetical protein AOBTE_LOCUS12330 [Acanthoscelides obtectus]